MSTVLVTMATGQQGRGVVRSLLAAGMRVHALTRDASSEAARALASSGASVFEGSFTDAASLERAVAGCTGVFLNLMPLSAHGEENDAAAVLAAARAAGTVRHVIYTSVLHADWAEGFPADKRRAALPPGGWMARYFDGKVGVERAVREAGFERWTVLRPGAFMTNFLRPASGYMYPELPVKGILRTAFDVDKTAFGIIDPADVGLFAAKAFLEPVSFSGATVDIASENLNIRQIAAALEKGTGKSVTLQGWTAEEIKEPGENMQLHSQLMQESRENKADLNKIREYGIELKTLAQFLEEHKEEAIASVGTA